MRTRYLVSGLRRGRASVDRRPSPRPRPSTNPPPPPPSPMPRQKLSSPHWRASKLVGLNVYNEQNEKLGDISEILLDKSGKVDGVVIGVGGFLGMGQRDIKVELSKLKFVERAGAAHHDHPTTADRAEPPGRAPRHHHHGARHREVVSGPCGAERRHQGPAQGDAGVQVQRLQLRQSARLEGGQTRRKRVPAVRHF